MAWRISDIVVALLNSYDSTKCFVSNRNVLSKKAF